MRSSWFPTEDGSFPSGSLPGQCNFESGVCGYIQDRKEDEADWLRVRGHTPTSYTGPRGDHTSGVGESFPHSPLCSELRRKPRGPVRPPRGLARSALGTIPHSHLPLFFVQLQLVASAGTTAASLTPPFCLLRPSSRLLHVHRGFVHAAGSQGPAVDL